MNTSNDIWYSTIGKERSFSDTVKVLFFSSSEIKLLTNCYLSLPDNKEDQLVAAVTAVDVVLFGLNTIIPLMTEDLLKVGNSDLC